MGRSSSGSTETPAVTRPVTRATLGVPDRSPWRWTATTQPGKIAREYGLPPLRPANTFVLHHFLALIATTAARQKAQEFTCPSTPRPAVPCRRPTGRGATVVETR
jgi:hypothetical protein